MKKLTSILLFALFAGAWAWASFKPWDGFRLLVIAGSLVSLPVILEGLVKMAMNFFIIAIVTTVSVLVPFLAPFCAIYLLYAAFQKMTAIISNIFLIITGSGMYLLLYFVPSRLAALFNLPPVLQAILLVVVGVVAILAVCRMLIRLGYPEDKVAAYVIGFPGFIIMLLFMVSGDSGDLFGSDQD